MHNDCRWKASPSATNAATVDSLTAATSTRNKLCAVQRQRNDATTQRLQRSTSSLDMENPARMEVGVDKSTSRVVSAEMKATPKPNCGAWSLLAC